MRSEASEAAYVEFVTARQTHLRRIAYAVCGDWGRADELLQAALVKLYVAWPRLQREGTEDVYVRRLLVRANVDAHPTPPDDGRSPLFAALQALPAKQRKAVLLRHWLGLSVEEAAEDLGTSAASVRGQTERAEAALRDALRDAVRDAQVVESG